MEKNQIYWFTDVEIEHNVDLYDKNYKDNTLWVMRNFLRRKFDFNRASNANIKFETRTIVLKPIEADKYEVADGEIWSPLIYIFNYFLFEEKFAAKITEVTKEKIAFEKVEIFENGKKIETKSYFRMKEVVCLEIANCATTRMEEDAIFIVKYALLYFSESLKNKLYPFVKKNYPRYRFVPGIPCIIC